MTITYQYHNSLYLNITNRCHCNCVFCIRQDYDGVGDGNNLWLERDPAAGEVIAELEALALQDYAEVVFCGYGEPTERLEVMLEVCRYLRESAPELPIRLNTNGLADLLCSKPVAPLLAGLMDSVSISLNAPNIERYMDISRPALGKDSYDYLLRFAAAAKQYIPDVRFSVVDVLAPEEIRQCQLIADGMGIPLRVRAKS